MSVDNVLAMPAPPTRTSCAGDRPYRLGCADGRSGDIAKLLQRYPALAMSVSL
jgi:hypothetical protein